MRQAGVIPNESDARRFVDYLFTQGIEAKTDASGDQWVVWVYDETRLSEGKTELQAFLQNPKDAKYVGVEKKADSLRRETQAQQRKVIRNFVDVRQRWASPGVRGPRLLTILLIVICVAIALLTDFGKRQETVAPYLYMTAIGTPSSKEDLSISIQEAIKTGDNEQLERALETAHRPYDLGLPEIRRGELWRLVTPILMHGSFFHLLFNMYMLFVLGGMIEDRYGSWWLASLVLVTAIVSNLTQYFWSGPLFAGMSGVDFALFGYIWMKSKFDPSAGLYLGERDVFLMLLWFAVCFTGLMGPIANGAHAGGLAAGMILGYLPKLLRR
jgi:GlpG protein